MDKIVLFVSLPVFERALLLFRWKLLTWAFSWRLFKRDLSNFAWGQSTVSFKCPSIGLRACVFVFVRVCVWFSFLTLIRGHVTAALETLEWNFTLFLAIFLFKLCVNVTWHRTKLCAGWKRIKILLTALTAGQTWSNAIPREACPNSPQPQRMFLVFPMPHRRYKHEKDGTQPENSLDLRGRSVRQQGIALFFRWFKVQSYECISAARQWCRATAVTAKIGNM